MPLKKRMFRLNLMILTSAILAMAFICGILAVIFEDALEKDFESVGKAKVDSNAYRVSRLVQNIDLGAWESLSKNAQDYGYEILVLKDGSLIYGSRSKNLRELQNDFENNKKDAVTPEIYYRHGITVVRRYEKKTGYCILAARFDGDYHWLDQMGRNYPILFILMFIIGIFGIVVLFVISYLFSRRLNQRITEPLNALVEGAERIQKGNLCEEIVYQGEEEFENVVKTFNDMQKTILEDQKQRIRNEKARTDMVTGISHDLRTPLTSIRGYIKAVLDGIADTEEKRAVYLKTAYESTEEMNILMQKLFDFSKMESGQMQFHMIQADLAEYTQTYLAQKEAVCNPEKVSFAFQKEDEMMPEIQMDVDQIRRIFDNLLENSLKYGKTEPIKIQVHICLQKEFLVLQWKDNGQGVDETKIGRIFDRFYRCDEARSKKGSGVGLYVVQYIMKQHGGYARAENDDGFNIQLYFPRALA